MSAAAGARPRASSLLSAQFADGFGARFHGVLLGLYALQLGGLEGFAGFVAASMVGAGLSAVAAGWLATRLGGATIMRLAGGVLLAARLASYVLIPFGLPLAGLIALRLVGAVSGTVLNTGAKTQVPEGTSTTTSLAWMNVANGAGQAAAALAAALLSTGSPLVVAAVGGPVAIAATWPMLRLARFSTAAPVPLREQLRGLRLALLPIVLGAAVFVVLNALPNLADGVTAELYSAVWLGPLSLVAFVGSVTAALVLPRVARAGLARCHDALLWSGLAAVGVAGWAAVDRGVAWLFAARFLAGFVAQALAALVEARVMERAGRGRALPALSASSAIASFGGAGATAALPHVLGDVGFAGTAALSCVALVVIAGTASGAVRVRAARRAGRLAAPAV